MPTQAELDEDWIQNVLAVGSTPADIFVLLTIYKQSNALNPSGQLYRSTRRRDADTELLLSANDALSCLWVSPSGHPWVGSSNGNVFTSARVAFRAPTDQALTINTPSASYSWSVTTLPNVAATGLSPNILAIWGTDDDSVFLATADGAIYFWNGADWAEQPTGVDSELIALHGNGPDDVYTAGDNAVILHFDGKQWVPAPMPSEIDKSDVITAIWAANSDAIFACSAQGKVLKGNRLGFQILADQEDDSWYGIALFHERLVLASSTSGAWTTSDGSLQLIRDRFNPVGLFHCGDRLYFIETEQPTPRVVEYAPTESPPWGRRSF